MRVIQAKVPYRPREWAKPFHASFCRFISLILHRRAGKTTSILNHHIRAAADDGWEARRLKHLVPDISERDLRELVNPPGGRHYGHVMPTRVQAKMVAWDKLKHYTAVIPHLKTNEAELLIRLPNGHKVQLFGADDPDAMRGIAPSGLSFDEFSQQPSNIFSEVLSKALGDHLGYAIFAGTIKGKDHLYRTFAAAKGDPKWFSLWQDVDRSLASEQGITIQVLKQAMADDRDQVSAGLMSQEEFDQEWFLSLEAAVKGAYYSRQLSEARKSGRITAVAVDDAYPVNTAWDLGHADDAAIWFYQNIRDEIRVVDCYAQPGGTIDEERDGVIYPGSLTKAVFDRPYRYGTHWLPHDARAKTMASNGKSIVERMAKWFGFDRLAIVPSLSIQDGITSARAILGRCWFDELRCDTGLNALMHYKRKYDARTEAYALKPAHDWSSHYADAFRMLAIAERKEVTESVAPTPAEKAAASIRQLVEQQRSVTLDQLWARRDEQQLQEVRI